MQFAEHVLCSASSIWLIGAINETFQSSELCKLHSEWQCLKKNINWSLATNLSYQEKFCGRLNDLFDIAHQVAMSTIKVEED